MLHVSSLYVNDAVKRKSNLTLVSSQKLPGRTIQEIQAAGFDLGHFLLLDRLPYQGSKFSLPNYFTHNWTEEGRNKYKPVQSYG